MLQIDWSSDRSLVIRVATGDTPEAAARVGAVWSALRGAALAGLIDATPAYASVSAVFDPARLDHDAALAAVRSLARRALDDGGESAAGGRVVTIPACYEAPHAIDLPAVAEHCGLSPAEVVSAHSGAAYRVRFLGFMPGFAYLSGLPAVLATPRRPAPRTRVPAGSVGIGGSQTGVYPLESPGGWRLIARTPTAMFDPRRAPAALLAPGDVVRFAPISSAEYERLRGRA